MTGYSLTINGEASTVETLINDLRAIQKKLEEGYKQGREGESYWDLEEL